MTGEAIAGVVAFFTVTLLGVLGLVFRSRIGPWFAHHAETFGGRQRPAFPGKAFIIVFSLTVVFIGMGGLIVVTTSL